MLVTFLLLAGLALLVLGAELLVRGASRIAAAAGIAPIVVGLTVVAFGTSTPELAVTLSATLRGDPDLALGNVVGSNIANILLILGATAAVAPLVVQQRIVRLEVPLLVLVSAATLLLAADGHISRLNGALAVLVGTVYVGLLVRHAVATGGADRREAAKREATPLPDGAGPSQAADAPPNHSRRSQRLVDVLLILGGLALLVLGGRWLVQGAEALARQAGVSELAIGLTVVAVGTSLPELATSIVATFRGEREIAVGNVVGSNLFNLLFILGLAAATSPTGVTASPIAIAFDLPIMIAVATACLPIFFTGHKIGRPEGLLLLAYFGVYTTYVLLAASGHRALEPLRETMIYFVVPMTLLGLGVSVFRDVRARLRAGLLVGGVALAGLAACSDGQEDLLLASTTSTEDSGLFDVLIPAFEAAHPDIDVHVTAIGTGQALELGRRGDADVLLVHAPVAESTFVAQGHGRYRCSVMYNDFVLVGPPRDPASIATMTDAIGALQRIAATASPFVSRGDDSGTHRKEQSLWQASGVEPTSDWYMAVGQGMAETLRMASETRAYALTDRATYLNSRVGLDLDILAQGDPRLFNPYGVVPVAEAANPEAAEGFATWITGPEAQSLIGGHGVDRLDTPLFVPDAEFCPPTD